MPELPDVETLKRYLDRTALNQRIVAARVFDARILGNVSPARLRKALEGGAIVSTRRHGKVLLAHIDKGGHLVLHFGMSGGLSYIRDPVRPPPYTRVLLDLVGGAHLAYVSVRMLGQVSLAGDVDEFIRRKGLGPDAWAVDREGFRQVLAGRRGRIKSALMNQRVLAGLGNIYVDESLFQGGIHPLASPRGLSSRRIDGLFDAMKRVLETAVGVGANGRRLPPSYLIHHRGRGRRCPRCGASIRRITVDQRGTYFCPRCQRK